MSTTKKVIDPLLFVCIILIALKLNCSYGLQFHINPTTTRPRRSPQHVKQRRNTNLASMDNYESFFGNRNRQQQQLKQQQQQKLLTLPSIMNIVGGKGEEERSLELLDNTPFSSPTTMTTLFLITGLTILLLFFPTTTMDFSIFPSLPSLSETIFSVDMWSSIAPMTSIALKLSPMPTILALSKRGDRGGLPLLPYTSMATLTFSLVLYGLLVHDPKISLTHGIGHCISLFYCKQYLHHTPTNASDLPGTSIQHKQIALSIIILLLGSIPYLGYTISSIFIGYSSAILSCLMYIGPLCRAKNAFMERQSNMIPLPFAIGSMLNSISWFIYGYYQRYDPAIYLPGLVGVVSSLIQLGIHCFIHNEKKDE